MQPFTDLKPWLKNAIRMSIAGLAALAAGFSSSGEVPPVQPNLVIIVCDDLGYADIGKYGAEGYRTPNLDRMADEGVVFRNFHVAQPVCSASRCALLTGCYPNRLGMHLALGPKSKTGISEQEMTLAELLKQQGYATAIFGKWHLGDSPQFMPLRHGFDEYFGLALSADYWPGHPDLITNFPRCWRPRNASIPTCQSGTAPMYSIRRCPLTT